MIAYTDYATENRARLEAEALVRLGFDVTFLVLKEEAACRRYSDGTIQVRELNVPKYQGKSSLRYALSYLNFVLYAFWECTRLFLTDGFAAVHVHNMPDLVVFAGLVPRLCGRRLILDIHDSMAETYLGKFNTNSRLLYHALRLEEIVCCWLATNVVCVNHPQRDAVVAHGVPARKITTIISIPKFLPQARPAVASQESRSFKLVYHGTIARRLGLDLAVEAVAKLVDVIPGIQFHIYGSGDDLDEVLARADALGVKNRVLFHGVVDWQDLPSILKEMDLGVVGNRRNIATELMLPAKLMDYLSLNIPVVAPRLKAIAYYFSDDMVKQFEPENVEDMASAILELYKNRSRRQLQAQRAQRFLVEYGWNKQQHCLQELYEGRESRKPWDLVNNSAPEHLENVRN